MRGEDLWDNDFYGSGNDVYAMAIDPVLLDAVVKILLVIFYANLIAVVGWNALKFKRTVGTWRDQNAQSTAALMPVFACIAVFMITKVDFTNLPDTRPWFIIIPILLVVIPPGLLSIALTTTVIQKKRGILKVRRYGTEVALQPDVTEKVRRHLNFNRKIFHGVIFVAMGAVIFIVAPFAMDYGLLNFWGDWTGTSLRDWWSRAHPYSVAQGIIIVIFFVFSWFTMGMESARISDKLQFPFLKGIQTRLRASEMDTYASYAYFFSGFLFTSLFLSPTLMLGALALFTFGDSAASAVGIRVGRHKVSFNIPKTWEGTFGGCVASFLAGIPFVGVIWSLAGGILFVIIDLLTPRILCISDNLLIPVAVPLLYWFLALLGIPATCIFLP